MASEKHETRPVHGVVWVILVALPLILAACGGKDQPKSDKNNGPVKDDSHNQLINVNTPSEIIIEAEDAKVVAPMAIKTDDGAPPDKREIYHASAGKFAEIPKDVGKGDEAGGKAIFTFNTEKRGTYMLWARVRWNGGCYNSFGVSMDGGPQAVIGEDGTYFTWQWVCLKGKDGIFSLAKGKHALEFRNTEDGVALDQILLTTNLDEQAQPQGILSR